MRNDKLITYMNFTQDGEICQLQTDIMNLELTRESMASELVELANKNTALEESTKHYPVLKKEHADMEVQWVKLGRPLSWLTTG